MRGMQLYPNVPWFQSEITRSIMGRKYVQCGESKSPKQQKASIQKCNAMRNRSGDRVEDDDEGMQKK